MRRDEKEGLLHFRVMRNDGASDNMIGLISCKNIYSRQLPKMPKEYIVRLVLDRQHTSLGCFFKDELVGGITYRHHPSQAFGEIAFCAVSASHQARLLLCLPRSVLLRIACCAVSASHQARTLPEGCIASDRECVAFCAASHQVRLRLYLPRTLLEYFCSASPAAFFLSAGALLTTYVK